MGLRIARAAQRRRGSHARSRFLTLGLLVPFQVRYGKPFTRNAWVCSDAQVVAEYNADPLCGFEFYANGYEALMQLMIWANTPAATAHHREMPVAFFSGAKDPCMGGKRRLKAAAELLRRAGYTDVSVKTYPGMAHEILNEAGREEVYDDMLAKMEEWLEAPGN